MKIFLKKVSLLFLLSSFLMLSGCDQLNNLTLNVPLVIYFSSSGPNTSPEPAEADFCLSDYTEWEENQDDIESANYLAASYWTLPGCTPNLKGDVSVSLFNNGGLIFMYSLGNITASDYLENPFELELNQSQIEALNSVLNGMADNEACFSSSLNITNITGDKNAAGNFVLNGKVEIVIETEVKTN